jgi:hypothetical protein
MKNLNTYFKAILGIVFIAIVFYTCKKDSNIKTGIFGTWVNTIHYSKAQLYAQTFVFNTDSTVQISRTVVDSASGNMLGYQYLSNGKFRLNGDQLKLYKLVSLRDTIANTYYLPANQLTAMKKDTLQTYIIKINADGNSFYFYYPPCPPNANCIGQLNFIKKK